MSTKAKLISYERLQKYDELIKKYADDGHAAVKTIAEKGLKTVILDGRTLKFYTIDQPVGETEPTFLLTIPETDLTTVNSLIGQNTSDITAINEALGTGFSKTSTVASAIADAKKAGTDAQSDVDALELVVGKASKAAVGTVGEEGYEPAVAATGIIKDIEDLKAASSTGVDGKITAAIEDLDATVSSEDVETGKGVKVTVTEADGVITNVAVAGNYDAKYDAIGAAAAVQGDTTETVASVDAKVEGLGTAADADVATVAIGTEGETTTALPTVAQVKSYVDGAVSDLEGAMHFVGVITRNEGETDEQAIARVITAPTPGDVVVMSDNAKEYIFVDPDPETEGDEVWREVGDEGLYVHKSTTIAGVDLQDNITASELKTALDVDDLETKVGDKTVATRIADEAKDATYTAAVEADVENGIEGKARVTIAQAIKANADAIANIDVSGDIDSKIESLDADKTSAAVEEGKGIQVQVVEVDGKIDSVAVTGSFDAKYDEIGAAAAVKDELDYEVATEDEITALFAVAE